MALGTLKKRQLLRIVADDSCQKCLGTGLHISSEHSGYTNKVVIEVVVCPCVKVVRRLPKGPGDGQA